MMRRLVWEWVCRLKRKGGERRGWYWDWEGDGECKEGLRRIMFRMRAETWRRWWNGEIGCVEGRRRVFLLKQFYGIYLQDANRKGEPIEVGEVVSRPMAGANCKEREREEEVPSSHAFQLENLDTKKDLDD